MITFKRSSGFHLNLINASKCSAHLIPITYCSSLYMCITVDVQFRSLAMSMKLTEEQQNMIALRRAEAAARRDSRKRARMDDGGGSSFTPAPCLLTIHSFLPPKRFASVHHHNAMRDSYMFPKSIASRIRKKFIRKTSFKIALYLKYARK